jgi:cytochrome c-type biogenesis protein CcmH/NrfG
MSRIQGQIDRDPKLAQAWAVRGKIYLAQRDFTHAETDLLEAVELDPNLEPTYVLLAELYVASNRTEQALEKLNGFIEKKQTVPMLMLLAGIQQRTRNFAAARDAYEKVLGLSANYTPALNNLAVIYSERLNPRGLRTRQEGARHKPERAPYGRHVWLDLVQARRLPRSTTRTSGQR